MSADVFTSTAYTPIPVCKQINGVVAAAGLVSDSLDVVMPKDLLTQPDIAKYAQSLEDAGWNAGGVVIKAHRAQFTVTAYDMGVILFLNRFGSRNTQYSPLRVRWVGAGMSNDVEDLWPHELVMVHPGLVTQDKNRIVNEAKRVVTQNRKANG